MADGGLRARGLRAPAWLEELVRTQRPPVPWRDVVRYAVAIPAPLFAFAYLAYTWYASRRQEGRINHDAHFSGALAGIAFVALTDGAAIGRAWRQLVG